MFFIRLGKFVAWALIILGGVGAVIGLVGVFTSDPQAWSHAYMGADTLGEEIDQRLMMVGVGLIFGLLVEIAERLGAAPDSDAKS